MRDILFVPAKVFTRLWALIGKEWLQVLRQPGALVTLVFAPFGIMALFGFGYSGERRPLDTAIVLPSDDEFPTDPEIYRQIGGPAINIVRVNRDLESARTSISQRTLDLVVVLPANARSSFLAGQQVTIGVEQNRVDPLRDTYTRIIADRQVQELNRQIIQRAVSNGQEYLVQNGATNEITKIPPEVLAAPARAEVTNWAPITPSVIGFFAPAVLALVLQHMAVTLTALSLVRERLSGVTELFRVSPVSPVEILLGTYIAYGVVCMIVAALVVALTVFGLGVPMLGDPLTLAGIVGLLIFASLGVGMLISTVSDSERQAVQLSMLVLLASVFFSGFVLSLDEFAQSVQWGASILPVTNGIRLLQDSMLWGGTNAPWAITQLAVEGGLLFLATAIGLSRSLAHQPSGGGSE